MPQHLQMTRITVKVFATMKAVPANCLNTTLMHSLLVSLGFTIFSSGKPRTAAGHGSKKNVSKSPSLMQLSELKQAVTCGKNSGCRLDEKRRSEFTYELHLSSQQM